MAEIRIPPCLRASFRITTGSVPHDLALGSGGGISTREVTEFLVPTSAQKSDVFKILSTMCVTSQPGCDNGGDPAKVLYIGCGGDKKVGH